MHLYRPGPPQSTRSLWAYLRASSVLWRPDSGSMAALLLVFTWGLHQVHTHNRTAKSISELCLAGGRVPIRAVVKSAGGLHGSRTQEAPELQLLGFVGQSGQFQALRLPVNVQPSGLTLKTGQVVRGTANVRCSPSFKNKTTYGPVPRHSDWLDRCWISEFRDCEPQPRDSPAWGGCAGLPRGPWVWDSWRWRARDAVKNAIERRLQNSPHLAALSQATWLADQSGLPLEFIRWHQASGLSHALAVSAQHMLILSTIVSIALRFLVAVSLLFFDPRGKWLRLLYDCGLCGCGLFYFFLCPAEGSVVRAFACTLVVWLLRVTAWSTSSLRVLLIGVVGCGMGAPEVFTNLGFLLSAVGAVALIGSSAGLKGWGKFLCVSIALPVFLIPVQAHFFGSADPFASIHALAFGTVWALVWIPLGFFAPVLPEGVCMAAERLFSAFVQWVIGIALQPAALWRPHFWEACGLCLVGLGISLQCIGLIWSRAATKLAAPCVDFVPKSVSNK